MDIITLLMPNVSVSHCKVDKTLYRTHVQSILKSEKWRACDIVKMTKEFQGKIDIFPIIDRL